MYFGKTQGMYFKVTNAQFIFIINSLIKSTSLATIINMTKIYYNISLYICGVEQYGYN